MTKNTHYKFYWFYRVNFFGDKPLNVVISVVNVNTWDEKVLKIFGQNERLHEAAVSQPLSRHVWKTNVRTDYHQHHIPVHVCSWSALMGGWTSALCVCAHRPAEASAAALQQDHQCSELRERPAPLSRGEISLNRDKVFTLAAPLHQKNQLCLSQRAAPRFPGCFLAWAWLVSIVTH